MAAPTVENLVLTRTLKVVNAEAEITSDGGETVTEKGFEIGVSPTDFTQTVVDEDAGTTFDEDLNLTSGTFYIRGYATNDDGTGYTAVQKVYVFGNSADVASDMNTIDEIIEDQVSAGYTFAFACPSNTAGNILLFFYAGGGG